jgi:hypothetical protein
MPRRLSWGLPGGAERKSEHYVQPPPPYRRVLLALALAGGAAALLLLLEAGGRMASPLRALLQPGALVEKHSTHECEACHVPARGVSNFRCQRCHDESGPGRMTQAAHVGRHLARLGAADARALARTSELECVRCHVEHRGRRASLVIRDDAQCVICHGRARDSGGGPRPVVAGFAGHPEFRLLEAAKGGAPRQQAGVYFSHQEHLTQVAKNLKKSGRPDAGAAVCLECHRIDAQAGTREFEPILADAHCFACHVHAQELQVQPVSVAELVADDSLAPPECVPDAVTECEGGTLQRQVEHKDPFVLRNARKLRRELFPEEHAADYARTLAEVAQLRRRLFLAQPLAALDAAGLEARRDAFAKDIAAIEARLTAREGRPKDATGGFARVEEVLAAAEAAAAPEAAALRGLVEHSRAATPQSDAAFDRRRQELLELLDRVQAAEVAPETKARAAYLRLRLLSMLPGEPAGDGLRRAKDQRALDKSRVEDELLLRGQGFAPVDGGASTRRLEEALELAEEKLRELRELDALPAARPEQRERKLRALEALLGGDHEGGCAKCHKITNGTIGAALAARPVLTLSAFAHDPHLRAAPPRPGLWQRLTGGAAPAEPARTACLACHPGVEKSALSEELHLQPIASCRTCHAAGAQREDCVLCHRYHPPPRP